MPVNIFGQMEGGSASRVEGGGATLTQINNTFLRRDGANAAVENIDLGTKKLINVADPSDLQDAATKNYVHSTAFGPAFSAYNSDPKFQGIPGIIHTKVLFNTTRCDTDNCFITGSSRFFPQKAGYYIVSAYVEFQDDKTKNYGNVFLYKNGTSYMQIAGGGGVVGLYINATGNTVVYLTNTDYLEIFAEANASVVILGRDFSAAYLRP